MVAGDAGAAAVSERHGRDGRALVRQHMYAADPEPQDRRRSGASSTASGRASRTAVRLAPADIVGSRVAEARTTANERFEARVAAVLAEKPAVQRPRSGDDGDDVIALFERNGLAAGGFRGDRRVGEVLAARCSRRSPTTRLGTSRDLLAERAERYIDEHFSASRRFGFDRGSSSDGAHHRDRQSEGRRRQEARPPSISAPRWPCWAGACCSSTSTRKAIPRQVSASTSVPSSATSTTCCSQRVPIAEIVRPTEVENLWIVPATLESRRRRDRARARRCSARAA